MSSTLARHARRLLLCLPVGLAASPAVAARPQVTPEVIYVDVAIGADLPGMGASATPYRTIAYALAQESDPVRNDPPLELRVAAGTYSLGTGESFPLTLVPGTAIVGAADAPFGDGTVIRSVQGILHDDPIIDVRVSPAATPGGRVELRRLEIVTGTRIPIEAELASGSAAPLELELESVRVRGAEGGPLLLPTYAVDFWIRPGSDGSLAGGTDFPAGELILRDCQLRAAGAAVRARVASGRARMGVEGGSFRAMGQGLWVEVNGSQRELVLELVGARVTDCKTGLLCSSVAGGRVTSSIREANFVGNGVACDTTIDVFTGETKVIPRGAIEDQGTADGNVTHAIQRTIFHLNGQAGCPKHFDLPDYRAADYGLADNVYSIFEPYVPGTGVVAEPGFVGAVLDASAPVLGPNLFDMHLHRAAAARDLGSSPALPGTPVGPSWVDADGQQAADPCGDGTADAGVDEWRETAYAFPRLVVGSVGEVRLLGEPGHFAVVALGALGTTAPSICPTAAELIWPARFAAATTLDGLGIGRVDLPLGPDPNPELVGKTVHLQALFADPVTGAVELAPVRRELLHGE